MPRKHLIAMAIALACSTAARAALGLAGLLAARRRG